MTLNKDSIDIQRLEKDLVYNKLVTDNRGNKYDTLVGKVAYSLYIEQKNQFIKKREKSQDKAPSTEDLKAIIEYLSHGEMIKSLRDTAIVEVNKYSSMLIYEDIERIIRKKRSFFLSIVASLIATFIYSVIIAVVIFTVNKDPSSKVGKIINIIFEENYKVSKTPIKGQLSCINKDIPSFLKDEFQQKH